MDGVSEAVARRLASVTTTTATLGLIVDAARRHFAEADLVTATLRTPNGKVITPAETGEVVTDVDRAKEREGLAVGADRIAPTVIGSEDLRGETRWPQLAAAARRHGFGAMLSTELFVAGGTTETSVALDIYSRRPRGLTNTDRDKALLLATHGSLALAHAQAIETADVELTQLRRAIESRDIIGQAKGILMARQGITADEAFELLRSASQELNVKLVDLARCLANNHATL